MYVPSVKMVISRFRVGFGREQSRRRSERKRGKERGRVEVRKKQVRDGRRQEHAKVRMSTGRQVTSNAQSKATHV